MFKDGTVKKAVLSLMNYEKECVEIAENLKLSISSSNQKIGRVLNVSLPPVLTCGNCGQCKKYCYDIKAVLQYPNTVVRARMRNYMLLKANRDEYFRQISEKIRRRRVNKFFRWHVAGDIVDADYLDRMVQIARKYPEFTFWTYTKMYDLVNAYCDAHGGKSAIPENLTIMFSEWRGLPMDNRYGFPEFHVVFKGEEMPKGVHVCPGNCDVCNTTGRGCPVGETTYAKEH